MQREFLNLEWDWKECAIWSLGEDGYIEYKNKVVKAFKDLKPGRYYDITEAPRYRWQTILGIFQEFKQMNKGYELSPDNTIIFNRNYE